MLFGRRRPRGHGPRRELVFAAAAGLLATQEGGQLTSPARDQPRPRRVRGAVGRPLSGCGEQSLLDRVLGQVEMPVAAHQCPKHLWRTVAQQVLDGGRGGRVAPSGPVRAQAWESNSTASSACDSAIGRTSAYARAATPAGAGASTSRAAIATARSRLSHSTTQYPANTSSVSA